MQQFVDMTLVKCLNSCMHTLCILGVSWLQDLWNSCATKNIDFFHLLCHALPCSAYNYQYVHTHVINDKNHKNMTHLQTSRNLSPKHKIKNNTKPCAKKFKSSKVIWKPTTWVYISNIKQFEFYSHMNWFQVKTQLTTFTQFNINIIKTQLSN
jgi:hypothetical protein